MAIKSEKNRKYYRKCSNDFAADCRLWEIISFTTDTEIEVYGMCPPECVARRGRCSFERCPYHRPNLIVSFTVQTDWSCPNSFSATNQHEAFSEWLDQTCAGSITESMALTKIIVFLIILDTLWHLQSAEKLFEHLR